MRPQTIFVEQMHGFDVAVSRFPAKKAHLVYGDLTTLLEQPTDANVCGLVKGPRRRLTPEQIDRLHRQFPHAVIAYIGRHPGKVLPEGVQLAESIPIVPLEQSPLSDAVADYTLGVAEAIMNGKRQEIEKLSVNEGNTFSTRRGHSFQVSSGNFAGLGVVVLGAGDIGSRVINRFNIAGAKIMYVAKHRKSFERAVVYDPSVRHILEQGADIVTNHLSESGRIPLEHARDIGLFIHTGAKTNVDENELVRALEEGRIQTAVVDIVANEETGFLGGATDSQKERAAQLIKERRLIITPHIAYLQPQAIEKVLNMAVVNILQRKGEEK